MLARLKIDFLLLALACANSLQELPLGAGKPVSRPGILFKKAQDCGGKERHLVELLLCDCGEVRGIVSPECAPCFRGNTALRVRHSLAHGKQPRQLRPAELSESIEWAH